MKLKWFSFGVAFIIVIAYSCTKDDRSVSVTIKNATVLYSVHSDSLRIKFPGENKKIIIISPQGRAKREKPYSNVSLMLTLILKNNYDTDIGIQLNDLNMHYVSFEPLLFLKNKTLKFYNYPFSLSRLPIKNSFVLKSQESKVIDLESPIFYYSETFNELKLDSFIKTIKKENFKIALGKQNTNVQFNLDSRKMIIVSKPNTNFPIYPKNGSGF
jgi:hypothetical protein